MSSNDLNKGFYVAVTRKKAKTSSKAISPDSMRSFRRYPGEKPFFAFRISQQTFYWLIIGLLVLGIGILTIFLTIKLQIVYDRIETAAIINE